MRNLAINEMTKVNGCVKCEYDYQTTTALKALYDTAATEGWYGTSAYYNLEAQLIANAPYNSCKV